jgi:hypothetical protein
MPDREFKFAPGISEADKKWVIDVFARIDALKASGAWDAVRFEVDFDYPKYLRSAKWKRIKKRVLERDQWICQCCGGRGTEVHHRSYDPAVMDGKDDSKLTTVCSGCHDTIHYTDSGSKRSMEETERLFAAGLRERRDIPEIIIDLRSRFPSRPLGWSRMTAIEKSLWHEKYRQGLIAKRAALNAKKAARSSVASFSKAPSR